MNLKIFIQHGYWLKQSVIKLGTETLAWFWLLEFLPFSQFFFVENPKQFDIFKI